MNRSWLRKVSRALARCLNPAWHLLLHTIQAVAVLGVVVAGHYVTELIVSKAAPAAASPEQQSCTRTG